MRFWQHTKNALPRDREAGKSCGPVLLLKHKAVHAMAVSRAQAGMAYLDSWEGDITGYKQGNIA